MSKNTDRVLGHANESDGIEEYDNPLPDWWLGMFIVCIIWGVGYTVWWHFIAETSQAKLYDEEMAQAALMWPELDRKAEADMSPESLALGEETFGSTCASCHSAALTGGIGPNLIDTEWIHGGTFDDIATTITEGVAAKGMPAWGPILGPKKVAAVTSYILSKNTGEAPAAAPAGGADEGAADDAVATDDGAAPDAPVDGEAVFTANCVACHQADMTGGIGPNLIDEEWIHGGELADIQRTVTEGVPAKGMITWKGVLTDAQIAAVSQYIYDKSHAN